MRFMAIQWEGQHIANGPVLPPTNDQITRMVSFHEEQVKARVLLQAEGLHPSSKGARVRFSGKKRTVTDGPFTETKELVAGFWIIEAKSMEEAIEWVKRIPNVWQEDTEIEVRQVADAEDLGEAMTPELEAQIARLHSEAPLGHRQPEHQS
jgi:hypothetical protein